MALPVLPADACSDDTVGGMPAVSCATPEPPDGGLMMTLAVDTEGGTYAINITSSSDVQLDGQLSAAAIVDGSDPPVIPEDFQEFGPVQVQAGDTALLLEGNIGEVPEGWPYMGPGMLRVVFTSADGCTATLIFYVPDWETVGGDPEDGGSLIAVSPDFDWSPAGGEQTEAGWTCPEAARYLGVAQPECVDPFRVSVVPGEPTPPNVLDGSHNQVMGNPEDAPWVVPEGAKRVLIYGPADGTVRLSLGSQVGQAVIPNEVMYELVADQGGDVLPEVRITPADGDLVFVTVVR